MFGFTKESPQYQVAVFLGELDSKLDSIIHDLQQIKTSQRASQKRERKTLKKV